jgi:hypothetical protein
MSAAPVPAGLSRMDQLRLEKARLREAALAHAPVEQLQTCSSSEKESAAIHIQATMRGSIGRRTYEVARQEAIARQAEARGTPPHILSLVCVRACVRARACVCVCLCVCV